MGKLKMILAVVGSRAFDDYDRMKAVLDSVLFFGDASHSFTGIVTGGAYGADRLAERYAEERGIPYHIHKPDWSAHGKAAGPIRNRLIVAEADAVLVFWDGASRGTRSTIEIANATGKPVYLELI